MTPEEEARKEIDRQLGHAGWPALAPAASLGAEDVAVIHRRHGASALPPR